MMRTIGLLSTFHHVNCRALRARSYGFFALPKASLLSTRSRPQSAPLHATPEQPVSAAPPAAASQSTTGAGTGVHARWKEQWGTFLTHLHAGGHFAADADKVDASKLDADKGAVKRAVLSFGRARPDLRFSLPEDQLRALVLAGFPRPDRKSVNAYKRLEASILRGVDLPSGDGGPADTTDLLRMLYALSVVDPVTAELESPGLAAAACSLMPEIIKASQEEASVPREGQASKRGMPRPVFASSQRRAQRERAQQQQQQQGDGATGSSRRGSNTGSGSRRWQQQEGSGAAAQRQGRTGWRDGAH